MIRKLLSLPPNLVESFHDLENASREEWFCTSDPVGSKLGSGGGTAWLLESCRKEENNYTERKAWLAAEKRILLHAGGQSRRLPGYAPSGKILTPVPVFRWERGQRLGQKLLDLQLPLYERIMKMAPDSLHTLIASGDVYIRSEKALQPIPEADVVCYGLWVEPSLATHHGVFVSDRKHPDALDFMLQKPSLDELGALAKTHLFLMDIGIWILSDRAVELLMKRSEGEGEYGLKYYDLYSDFGRALGCNPSVKDPELNSLSVAILPLQGGEFYHYGTSKELISSTLSVQNLVRDQREIMHRKVKPNPAMFVQNSIMKKPLTAENENIWIENSYVGTGWKISRNNILTGIPANDWQLSVPPGICVDVIPLRDKGWVARPYGLNDAFKGDLFHAETHWMGKAVADWFSARKIDMSATMSGQTGDLQSASLFPYCESIEQLGMLLRWMICEPQLEEGKTLWLNAPRLSADEISASANLSRLYAQRTLFRQENWVQLASNYERSVFYQLNLADAAGEFAKGGIPLPPPLPEDATLLNRMHNHMFRARTLRLLGDNQYITDEKASFSLLREGLVGSISETKQEPRLNVYSDQIVWGRSPVRIDLAGGWTDTPPFCLYSGGNVVNMAIELNGQPPLQVYIKPSKTFQIVLRSIDLGAMEIITTYDELNDFSKVGSPFSIPKAALSLAGFAPQFGEGNYSTLEERLKAFGSGIEVTLLAAIPAGSGLGTSSVLAATVLGAVNDFCGLAWDKNEICRRTLVLEQLLTTGGGWQDQFGGVLQGVKLLQTGRGFDQLPLVRWLPDFIFSSPEYKPCHLLYYTGITRTAKGILAEIVSSMFLNSTEHLDLLQEMKLHALDTYEAIQRGNFTEVAALVGKTWQQNKALDSGTNPPAIEAIINQIKDYTLGYKLPGAGGGGYLYMIAKDPVAASRIKEILVQNPPNANARFVDMSLSDKGLQISRS